ncbi:MAG TPA: hypothetical protein VF666_09400 [Pyrinomonadaceae bacterium]|jgi:hypothetical protein
MRNSGTAKTIRSGGFGQASTDKIDCGMRNFQRRIGRNESRKKLLTGKTRARTTGAVTLLLLIGMMVALSLTVASERRPNAVAFIAQAFAFAFRSSVHWIWARRKELLPTTS